MDRIGAIIGAGVSTAAGVPTISKLTDLVLSGDGISRGTDSVYYFGKPMGYEVGMPDECVPRIKGLLRILDNECRKIKFGDQESTPNFEDLYFLLNQIDGFFYGGNENPAIADFIARIAGEIKPLLKHRTYDIKEEWTFEELTWEAGNYIQDIIWQMIIKTTRSTEYHKLIVDILNICDSKIMDIFTLNYDTIIEQTLTEHGVDFVDGFSHPINDVRYWQPVNYETENRKVGLFKLHGSINWFSLRSYSGDKGIDRLALVNDDPENTYDENGNRQYNLLSRPLMLVGTDNKLMRYTGGVFGELSCLFWQALRMCNLIILSGYSFRDRGINSRLIDWFYASNKHQIVVIHPDPSSMLKLSRPAIQRLCESAQNRISYVPKRFEDTSVSDLEIIE